MSWRALAWAAKCHVRHSADKLVLLGLAERHNDECGTAYPSIEWLADFSSLNRKTVITSLGRLEVAGLISDSGERKGRTRQVKAYSLHFETVPKSEQFQKRNSTEKSPKQSQKRDTEPSREPDLSGAKAPSRARAKPKVPLPDGWEPKPLTLGTVSEQIVAAWQPGRIERELSKFRDHHLRSDQRWSDWDAAWRTWIQKSGDFERTGNGQRNYGDDPEAAALNRLVASSVSLGGGGAEGAQAGRADFDDGRRPVGVDRFGG